MRDGLSGFFYGIPGIAGAPSATCGCLPVGAVIPNNLSYNQERGRPVRMALRAGSRRDPANQELRRPGVFGRVRTRPYPFPPMVGQPLSVIARHRQASWRSPPWPGRLLRRRAPRNVIRSDVTTLCVLASGGYEPAPTLFLLWSGSPYLSSRDAVRRRGDLHPGRGDCFVAVDRLLARTSNPTSPHSVYWLRAGTNPPLPFSTDGRAVPLCHRETPSGGVAISTPSREVTSSPLTGSLKGYRFAFPESRASRTHPTTAR
jgi:hypothetical protein